MKTEGPQAGTWTLTAPDGRTWQADSPLRCIGLEHRERVPPEISLERIFSAFQKEVDVVQEHVAAEREACAKICDEMGPDDLTGDNCAEAIRARSNAR